MIKTDNAIIATIALVNILIHFLFHNQLEFHRDELLYFALGKHPALGYFSVPPLIGWMATLMQTIFGFTIFSVKLLPILLSGAFVWITAEITKSLGGNVFAQALACLCLITTPFAMRTGILFLPVPFDFFFWSLIYLFIIRFINTNKDKYLYALGVTIGLAILNKYLVLLLLLSILILLPFSNQKYIFGRKSFYLCLLIALVICSPNIYWQWSMNFPVFDHLAALNETQLQLVSRSSILLDQVYIFYLGSIVGLFGLFFLLFKRNDHNYKLIGTSTLLILSILLLLRGKSYYTAGIYAVLIPAGAVYIGQLIKQQKLIKYKPAKIIVYSIILILFIPIVPYGLPVFLPKKLVNYFDTVEKIGIDVGRKFEDGSKHSLPQDYADMLGWEELANIVSQAYEQVTDKNSCSIYCEEYCSAGVVAVLGEKHGLPNPISFDDSFIYWIPDNFQPDLETFIYVNDNLGTDVEELFDEIILVGQIKEPLAREFGTKVYLCKKPNRSFNEFWQEVLARVTEN